METGIFVFNEKQQYRWIQLNKARAKKYGVRFSSSFTQNDIVKRDGFVCYLCKKGLALTEIQFDHVIPLSRGGYHIFSNVKVACQSCNQAKGCRTEYEFRNNIIVNPRKIGRENIVQKELKMNNMKKELFDRLLESANQALEHAEGKRELRTTVLPRPPAVMSDKEIYALREQLNVSQAVFARCLNVSIQTVQKWEQGAGKPSGAALKLLSIVRRQPKILLEA